MVIKYFYDTLSDIYLQRALKNNDLIYDNKYMNEMLDIFGEDITDGIKPGKSVVMNYGMLKDYTTDWASKMSSLDMSDMISGYLSQQSTQKLIDKAADYIISSGQGAINQYEEIREKAFQEVLGRFIDENLTDEIRKKIYQGNLGSMLERSQVGQLIDDVGLPLSPLSDEHISGLNDVQYIIKSRYEDNITKQVMKMYGIKADTIDDFKKIHTFDEIVAMVENAKSLYNADMNKLKNSQVDLSSIKRVEKRIKEYQELASPQIRQLEDYIIEKSNRSRNLQLVKDGNDMLNMFDKFTHFIKVNQTTIHPSFHLRNNNSNAFNNWLAVGNDAYNVKYKLNAISLIKGNTVDDVIVDVAGRKHNWKDLYNEAVNQGILDDNMFAVEIGAGAQSKGLFNKIIPGKYNPTDTKNFIPYKIGAEIGSVVESSDRFIHFVSQVKNGMNFQEAAESANKFLFDYSDLTFFEQNTMKRIMPYYTWLRKNAPLQLEMMLEKPEKYRMVSKLIGGIEGMNNEEDRMDQRFVSEFAQDWIQLPFYATNKYRHKEPILFNPNLPYMDLGKIPDPSNIKGSLQETFSSLNPLIKTPVELLLNKNTFFNSPIAKEGENRLTKSLSYMADQHGGLRVAKGFAQKNDSDFLLYLLNSTTGIKTLSYDYNAFKKHETGRN